MWLLIERVSKQPVPPPQLAFSHRKSIATLAHQLCSEPSDCKNLAGYNRQLDPFSASEAAQESGPHPAAFLSKMPRARPCNFATIVGSLKKTK
jgi:hypothetical protein